MKVLHVVNISFVLPYYIGEQFDYFREKGIEFYVACAPKQHFLDYANEKKFIPYPISIYRTINIKEDVRAIKELRNLIKNEKIDIVIGHTPKASLIAMVASYLAGVEKRIYFRHGIMFETTKSLKRILFKNIERFTASLATQVVCVSRSVLVFSEKNNLSSKNKNILLHKGGCNGIDVNRFSTNNIPEADKRGLKKQYEIREDDFVVGFVGRIGNDKGINELIEAWQLLKQKYTRIKLLLVGPFEIRDLITEERKFQILNDDTIVFSDLVEDTVPYFSIMNVFILPSYREGLPTAVLEASSMELPVITTRATGCIDSIINGETGTFIDIEPYAISKAIEHYMLDKGLTRNHGLAGRKFVKENFRQELVWKAIEKQIFNA